MKYKMGKLIEVFSQDGTKKVVIHKGSDIYRSTLYKKKNPRGFIAIKTRESKYKKYAERRFIELCEELN